jgi:hypothetical protein
MPQSVLGNKVGGQRAKFLFASLPWRTLWWHWRYDRAASIGHQGKPAIAGLFEKPDGLPMVELVPIHIDLMDKSPLDAAVLIECLNRDAKQFGGLPSHDKIADRKAIQQETGGLFN